MARHVQFGADAEHGSEGVAWDPIVDPLRNRNRDRFRINSLWVKIGDLGDHRFKSIFSIHHPIIEVPNFDP